MKQKIRNFNELESELNKLSFGKVLEIKDLTKQEADNLFDLYKRNYIIRGPHKELNGEQNYILSFELNYHKIRRIKENA